MGERERDEREGRRAITERKTERGGWGEREKESDESEGRREKKEREREMEEGERGRKDMGGGGLKRKEMYYELL